MYEYEHTQPGTLLRYVLGGFKVFALALFVLGLICRHNELLIAGGLLSVALTFTLMLFHSLTVRISKTDLDLRFGIGLVGRSILLNEIAAAEIVRNRWFYGWGIKRTPHGWLYNVSGLDAVQITMKNGRQYRIGTDEPDQLHAALVRVLG